MCRKSSILASRELVICGRNATATTHCYRLGLSAAIRDFPRRRATDNMLASSLELVERASSAVRRRGVPGRHGGPRCRPRQTNARRFDSDACELVLAGPGQLEFGALDTERKCSGNGRMFYWVCQSYLHSSALSEARQAHLRQLMRELYGSELIYRSINTQSGRPVSSTGRLIRDEGMRIGRHFLP